MHVYEFMRKCTHCSIIFIRTFPFTQSNIEGWTTISEPNGVNLFRLGDIVKASGGEWDVCVCVCVSVRHINVSMCM
jgi:hypothetical protein